MQRQEREKAKLSAAQNIVELLWTLNPQKQRIGAAPHSVRPWGYAEWCGVGLGVRGGRSERAERQNEAKTLWWSRRLYHLRRECHIRSS